MDRLTAKKLKTPKVKPVMAWVRVHDGKIEKEHLDSYGVYTTKAAAQVNWWGAPGEFIRVEIRPVRRKTKRKP